MTSAFNLFSVCKFFTLYINYYPRETINVSGQQPLSDVAYSVQQDFSPLGLIPCPIFIDLLIFCLRRYKLHFTSAIRPHTSEIFQPYFVYIEMCQCICPFVTQILEKGFKFLFVGQCEFYSFNGISIVPVGVSSVFNVFLYLGWFRILATMFIYLRTEFLNIRLDIYL